MHQRFFHRCAAALFLIAVSISWTKATAQSDPGFGGAGRSQISTPHVQAELIAHAPQGVAVGQPLWLGLVIDHQPGWHTYWKNPGDSGLPIELTWSLPAGLDAGEIAWPLPRKIAVGTLLNYGYEGALLLPVAITVANTFAPGPLAQEITVRLHAAWLVCRETCLPEEGDFTLQLPIRSSTALNGAAFEAAWQALPRPLDSGAQASLAQIDGGQLQISVPGLPAALRGKNLDLFPETPQLIASTDAWTQAWNGSLWTARIPIAPQRSHSPATLPVVLAEQSAGQSAGHTGYRAELQLRGPWPPAAAVAGVSPALQAALEANAAQAASAAVPAATAPTFMAALLGALLGGLILNLMPCVFPVLAIKLVGVTRHGAEHGAQSARRTHRASGLAYTAGVLLSFMALGALMLGLRAAGQAIGWGFQLQSPAVVAALAALFTLIGLNLAGVFEFGHVLPASVAGLHLRHPVADSFLTGVLAVAVASPCTAPFMGAALGLAAQLPASWAMALFAALGLGLALPYLIASWVPAVARALPHPGAWMDILRRLLAFPMFATVVWLVWVLGQQSGIDGAGALLILLVGLGLVVWTLSLTGRARRWLTTGAIAVMALLTGVFAPQVTRMSTPASATTLWQPWTPGVAGQIVSSGRPVFVDFTAAWCVTCQYNKQTTLANAQVLADLASKNVALLRADWTRRDPAITAALTALGRSGVPVYVFYRLGHPPLVLTEVLSVAQIRAAIAEL